MSAMSENDRKQVVDLDEGPPLWRSKFFILLNAAILAVSIGMGGTVYQIWQLIPPVQAAPPEGVRGGVPSPGAERGITGHDAWGRQGGPSVTDSWRPLTPRDGPTPGAGRPQRVNSDQSGANQGQGPVSSPPASAASRN